AKTQISAYGCGCDLDRVYLTEPGAFTRVAGKRNCCRKYARLFITGNILIGAIEPLPGIQTETFQVAFAGTAWRAAWRWGCLCRSKFCPANCGNLNRGCRRWTFRASYCSRHH